MLKSIFSSKSKTNNQTFSKKEYTFLKSFFKLFLNIIPILVNLFVLHINLIYKVWVDLMNGGNGCFTKIPVT